MKKNKHIPLTTKFFSTVCKLSLTILAVTSCTKTREASLPEAEQEQIIAISEFGEISAQTNFNVKTSAKKDSNIEINPASAINEISAYKVNENEVNVPERLQYMFKNLGIKSNKNEVLKIVFSVDEKTITAFKVITDKQKLTVFEKQLAVSVDEVQNQILKQKNSTDTLAVNQYNKKIKDARIAKQKSLVENRLENLLIPLFKYDILAKGVLKRTKNELKEETATLQLKETDFTEATHIKISNKLEDRKEIGSFEQKKELEQLFTADQIDNKIYSQEGLASDLQIQLTGKFKNQNSEVLTRLDAKNLNLYEIISSTELTTEQQRILSAGLQPGQITTCKQANVTSQKIKDNCVVILRASVPIGFKSLKLSESSLMGSLNNKLELSDSTKNDSLALVYIAKNSVVETVQSSGQIDPQNTFKIADLKGEFLFRRTLENASNAFLGDTGTSSETFITRFEMTEKRLIVRSTETLSKVYGQTDFDKQEILSFDANYFKLQTQDASGVKLISPQLIKTTLKEAEYVQIDWLKNNIPDYSSPMAFYGFGRCIQNIGGQEISDTKIELTKGIINFTIQSSVSVIPNCAARIDLNSYSFDGNPTQFNFNVKERLSFKRHQVAADQVLGNIPPQIQSALNFNGITLAEQQYKTKEGYDLRKTTSQKYKMAMHDFRDGKKLVYRIGGLLTADPQHQTILKKVTLDVIKDWNETFKKAFKGTHLERNSDYVEAVFDTETDQRNLGDLDSNYIWYFDLPFENGLLGVAQPAVNPRSGQIVASNVMMYPGNMSDNLKQFYVQVEKQRAYEILLEEIKAEKTKEILENWNQLKDEPNSNGSSANQIAGSNQSQVGSGNTDKNGALTPLAISSGQNLSSVQNENLSFLQSIALKSSYHKVNLFTRIHQNKIQLSTALLKSNNLLKFKEKKQWIADEKQIFSKRVIQKILKDDISKDPLVMEAIIAKEFLNSDTSLSKDVKNLIAHKLQLNQLKSEFKKSFSSHHGCQIESIDMNLSSINDRFLTKSFDENFEGIMKWVLAHEMGHAFGLIHNFKGSIDKANYAFPEENTDRNYSSVMDYIAFSQAPYRGLGPYDVHAIRSIYTNQIEIAGVLQNEEIYKSTVTKIQQAKDNNEVNAAATLDLLTTNYKKIKSVSLNQGNLIKIDDLLKLLNLNESQITKSTVRKQKLIKFFNQCNDMQVGDDPTCERYDWGSSAKEIVKTEIQDYNRRYNLTNHVGDKINFSWNEKISNIHYSLYSFFKIRNFLDALAIKINNPSSDSDEVLDLIEANGLGFNFFHSLIRTPDTKLGLVNISNKTEFKENLKQRLYPILENKPIYSKDANGNLVIDENNMPKVERLEKAVHFVEAKRPFDIMLSNDKFESLGINYDKMFAIELLFLNSPISDDTSDNKSYFSYLDFEKVLTNTYDPKKLFTIETLTHILNNTLKPAYISEDGIASLNLDEVLKLNKSVLKINSVNETQLPKVIISNAMKSSAIYSAVYGLNEIKSRDFDAIAEYYKVGRSEGGSQLKDRYNVRKSNTDKASLSTVHYWAADNAEGAKYFVSRAHLVETILENSHDIINEMSTLVKANPTVTNINALKPESLNKLAMLLKTRFILPIILENKSDTALNSSLDKAFIAKAKLLMLKTVSLRNVILTKSEQLNKQNLNFENYKMQFDKNSELLNQYSEELINEPLLALTHLTVINSFKSDDLKITTSDEDNIMLFKLVNAMILQPEDILKDLLSNWLIVLDALNEQTMNTNPEYKR